MKTRSCSSILVTTLFALAITTPVLTQEKDQTAGAETDHGAAYKKHLHYRLIDLGTFGGPSGYLATTNMVTGPGAINRVLNNRGTVVGWADTSALDPFGSSILGCFNLPPDCFLPHAFQWQKGVLTDLGVFHGGDASDAVWISDTGLIAGQARNGLVDPLIPGWAEIRAVL